MVELNNIENYNDRLAYLTNEVNKVSYNNNNDSNFNWLQYDDVNENENRGDAILSFILNQPFPCVIALLTNAFPKRDEIDDSTIAFLKNVFNMNNEFQSYMNIQRSNLPNSYILYHYRMGDHVLHSQCNIGDINNYIDHFRNSLNVEDDTPIVIISDSLFLKNAIKMEFPEKVFILDNTPHHFINHNVNIDTIVDFFLIQNAKEVRTYSNYSWISNFVLWTSIIFKIPLKRI